jgi:uncharacterized membrane protein
MKQAFAKRDFWFILACTVVGLILRLHAIERLSLGFDEATTVWKISRPYAEMFYLNRIDTVPPLYYYLLKSWTWMFGSSDLTIRLLSAMLGTVAIPLTALLATKLFEVNVGTVAAMLLAISTYHIQLSQEARSYALLFILFGFTLYFIILIQQRSGSGAWAGYISSGALLLYAHGISLLYLLTLNLYIFLKRENWRKPILTRWLIANSAIMLCFLPWIRTYSQQIGSFEYQMNLPKPAMGELSSTFILLMSLPPVSPNLLPPGLQTWNNILPLIQVAWLTTALFLLLAPLIGYRCERALLGPYLLLTFPIMVVFVFSWAVRSIYVDRLFFVCLLPFVIIFAKSFILLIRRSKTTLPILVLYCSCSVLSIYAYYRSDWKDDYHGASDYLVRRAQSGDTLIFMSHIGEIMFDWYSHGSRPDLIKQGLPEGIYERGEPEPTLRIRDSRDLQKLSQAVEQGRRFWFMRSRTYIHDPQELTRQWLDQHLLRTQTADFHGVQVLAYSSR